MSVSPRPVPSPPDAPSVRHRLIVAASVAILTLASAVATVYWFEADKEVRILCGLMVAGTPRAEVDRMLGTANLLEIQPAGVEVATAGALAFEAPANLRTTRCDVSFSGGGVATGEFTRSLHLERIAALLAIPLLLLLVGLQIGLATGRVSGRMAWGGVHETLTAAQRRASAFSALLLVGVGWILLERAGVMQVVPWTALIAGAAWAVVLLFLLSTLGNLASSSRPERRLGIPVATALLLLSFVVAYAG